MHLDLRLLQGMEVKYCSSWFLWWESTRTFDFHELDVDSMLRVKLYTCSKQYLGKDSRVCVKNNLILNNNIIHHVGVS